MLFFFGVAAEPYLLCCFFFGVAAEPYLLCCFFFGVAAEPYLLCWVFFGVAAEPYLLCCFFCHNKKEKRKETSRATVPSQTIGAVFKACELNTSSL